jgi:hypothetical protein
MPDYDVWAVFWLLLFMFGILPANIGLVLIIIACSPEYEQKASRAYPQVYDP